MSLSKTWLDVEAILLWLFTQAAEYIVMRLTATPLSRPGASRDSRSVPPSIFSAKKRCASAPRLSFACPNPRDQIASNKL